MDFAEISPLPSAWLSAKEIFADSLRLALGKDTFAERRTWPSAKGYLCRVSLPRLSAKNSALGKVAFSSSVRSLIRVLY